MTQDNNFSLDIWHVAIPVKNLEKSLRFYTDIIGMQLVGRDEYPSKRQAFVAVKPGGFTIELFERKGEAALKPAALPDHLAFECSDIDAFRKKAMIILNGDTPEVDTFDNGVKYLGLRDPDGVVIEIFQGRALYEGSL